MKKTGVFAARAPLGGIEEELTKKFFEEFWYGGLLDPYKAFRSARCWEDLRIMRKIRPCSSNPKNFPGPVLGEKREKH